MRRILLALVAALATRWNTYYLWFRESYLDLEPEECPQCAGQLKAINKIFQVCEECKIMI